MKMFKAISIVGLVLVAALVSSIQAFRLSLFLKQLNKKYHEKAQDEWALAAQYVDVLYRTREQIIEDAEDIYEVEDKIIQVSDSQTGKLQAIAAKFDSYSAELKRDIQVIRDMADAKQ